MSTTPVHCCHVCGALEDTDIVAIEVGGVEITFPHHFVFAYREAGKPLGLCNVCFEARRLDGFTADEIAYFQEEFTKPDETPDA
jgi:hypothetical protein